MSSSPYVGKAIHLGKKFIGYPEERPHTISSKDWVRDVFRNPKDEVRLFAYHASGPQLNLRRPGDSLCQTSLPYPVMDRSLQCVRVSLLCDPFTHCLQTLAG